MKLRKTCASGLAMVVALAIALQLTIVPASALTAVPSAPTSVTANVRSDHSVDVRWTLPAGSTADFVWVFEFTAAGQPVQLLQANADEPYKRFYVGTGKLLFFVAAANSAGNSPYTAGPVVDVAAGCSTADACLTVDDVPNATPNALVASGFLESAPQPSALVSALKPTVWRVADTREGAIVSRYASSKTLILSELWRPATSSYNSGYAAAPWKDWNNYRAWVTGVVKAAKVGGWAPQYWDLVNEADLMSNPANPYFAPADRSSATPANLLQMILVAYRAVRAADPTAKIVGPSFSEYQDSVTAPADRPNMRTFIQFAAANNMKLDAVSWHELNDQFSSYDGVAMPVVLTEHVERFRRQLAKYPALGNPSVFINEYTQPSTNLLPGWNAGYMGEIDRAPVAQANRTCWDTCFTPSIDGLLTQTDSTYSGTTASYWTYKAYADMRGATEMDAKSSIAWRFSGTATRDDASRTVRVLAGAHWGCAPSVNPSCTNGFDPGAMTASVDVPYAYGPTAVVDVYKLPAGVGPVAGPTLLSSVTTNVVGGRVAVWLSGVNDGDAISVILTPGA